MPFRHIHHAVLAIIMLLSTAVMAHSPLIAVTPVDGARLATAPQTIEMQFRDPSRLIRFTLAAEADG
ncbi:MAG: hypothetical protein VXB94_13150, partial [Rhodobiaceae bacterium]